MKVLKEKATRRLENRIPKLAERAVKDAYRKTLESGRKVVEAVDGKLVESHPDGTRKVLKDLHAPIPVDRTQKYIRRK